MRNLVISLILISFLAGCISAVRSKGEAYPGYSCRESLMHYYSYCSNKKFTKEEFDAEIKTCEHDLTTTICDKEYADLLWCMGRVEPGTYSQGGGIAFGGKVGIYTGNLSTTDGCDCGSYVGALKECKMKRGQF
jgi:hypothetical protein